MTEGENKEENKEEIKQDNNMTIGFKGITGSNWNVGNGRALEEDWSETVIVRGDKLVVCLFHKGINSFVVRVSIW